MKPYHYGIFLNGEEWMGGVHYAATDEEAIGHAMEQGERRKQFDGKMGKLTFQIEEYHPKSIERVLLKHG